MTSRVNRNQLLRNTRATRSVSDTCKGIIWKCSTQKLKTESADSVLLNLIMRENRGTDKERALDYFLHIRIVT